MVLYKKAFVLSSLFFASMLLMTSFAHANGAPWPSDIKIVPPDPKTPSHIQQLSGKWVGSTATGMGVRMAFEQASLSEFGLLKIQSVYAWDNKYVAAGWARQPANIVRNKVVFTVAEDTSLEGYLIECALPKDNKLSCTYAGRARGTIDLKRETESN